MGLTKENLFWPPHRCGLVFFLTTILLVPVLIPQARATEQTSVEKVYKVPGLHSNGCATVVQRAVRGVPGVRSVQLNLAMKEARVVFEEGLAHENS